MMKYSSHEIFLLLNISETRVNDYCYILICTLFKCVNIIPTTLFTQEMIYYMVILSVFTFACRQKSF